MRYILLTALLSGPATAWEFTPLPICTLTGPNTVLTYDAAIPEYTINIDAPGGWAGDGIFTIRYDGPAPLTISTDRQTVDGTMLTVADRGFGNVLNGMQFNDSFTATLGTQAVTVDLTDIGPAMEAFRACPAPVTS